MVICLPLLLIFPISYYRLTQGATHLSDCWRSLCSGGVFVYVFDIFGSGFTLTCIYILGMGVDLPINLEPGLVEWPGWFIDYPFKSAEELQELTYNINSDYQPVVPIANLNYSEERLVDEYPRSVEIVNSIVSSHQHQGSSNVFKNIGYLIVKIIIQHMLSLNVFQVTKHSLWNITKYCFSKQFSLRIKKTLLHK